jgi:hypothetical protein
MTLVDTDIEIFIEVDDRPDQACESPWHYYGPDGTNHHAEGGPLWYVRFTKQCHCGTSGVEIRCNSWAMAFRDQENRLFHCSCGGSWSVIVLMQVQDS